LPLSEVECLGQVFGSNCLTVREIGDRTSHARKAVDSPCREPQAIDGVAHQPLAVGIGPAHAPQLGYWKKSID
jgi:hypothetical protein